MERANSPPDTGGEFARSIRVFPHPVKCKRIGVPNEAHSGSAFAHVVNDVVIEFANAIHQSILDRFIEGEDIPSDQLDKVWTSRTRSPPTRLSISSSSNWHHRPHISIKVTGLCLKRLSVSRYHVPLRSWSFFRYRRLMS